jgi:hypothetical protein
VARGSRSHSFHDFCLPASAGRQVVTYTYLLTDLPAGKVYRFIALHSCSFCLSHRGTHTHTHTHTQANHADRTSPRHAPSWHDQARCRKTFRACMKSTIGRIAMPIKGPIKVPMKGRMEGFFFAPSSACFRQLDVHTPALRTRPACVQVFLVQSTRICMNGYIYM